MSDKNNKSHPLDQVFDIDPNLHLKNNSSGDDIDIPGDPSLDTIIELSLNAYKQQMDDIQFVEPKNRAKFFEISEKFLNQAKDAIHKKEQIKIQREKAMGNSKKRSSQILNESGEYEESPSVERNDLYKMKRVK